MNKMYLNVLKISVWTHNLLRRTSEKDTFKYQVCHIQMMYVIRWISAVISANNAVSKLSDTNIFNCWQVYYV